MQVCLPLLLVYYSKREWNNFVVNYIIAMFVITDNILQVR